MPELSKREKKIARMLVDKGVEAEFGAAVKQVDEIIAEWKNSNLDNRMAYKTILKKMKDHDKHIANRYDSLRGSDYLLAVAAIYTEGLITEDDIKDFSENIKAVLNNWLRLSKE